MSRYIRITGLPVFLTVLFMCMPPTVAAAGSDDQPNIVLVLMDNFGYGEVGVYGGGVMRGVCLAPQRVQRRHVDDGA